MKRFVFEVDIQVTLNERITLDSIDADTAIDDAMAYVESMYGKEADYKALRHMNLGDADQGRDYEEI